MVGKFSASAIRLSRIPSRVSNNGALVGPSSPWYLCGGQRALVEPIRFRRISTFEPRQVAIRHPQIGIRDRFPIQLPILNRASGVRSTYSQQLPVLVSAFWAMLNDVVKIGRIQRVSGVAEISRGSLNNWKGSGDDNPLSQ